MGYMEHFRSAELVAWNAIVFGIIMFICDQFGPFRKRMEDMTAGPALTIGVAQALAIIPGTSRSGITMSAARALGFQRPEAARFSFLLGLPAIAGSGILVLGDAVRSGTPITSGALYTGLLTIVTALISISFLMKFLQRYSLLPFVIYRLFLGAVLLALIYAGIPLAAAS
jgi:undecaprenyl-diphosphatase